VAGKLYGKAVNCAQHLKP